MRIAILGDIHAAAAPLRNGLKDARAAGFDQMLIIGDLFTYGADPVACADLVGEAISRDGAVLIGGNHDQLYTDLAAGDRNYFDRLPDWIQESVEWTWAQLGHTWPADLTWQDEWATDRLLVAHANPFGFGDWTYLSDQPELARAADVLDQRGFQWGVFGHVHRVREYQSARGVGVHIIGSIGQPRDRANPLPKWAMVEIGDGHFTLTEHNVEFDASAHCGAIRATSMTVATQARLCGFYQ